MRPGIRAYSLLVRSGPVRSGPVWSGWSRLVLCASGQATYQGRAMQSEGANEPVCRTAATAFPHASDTNVI